MAETPDADPPAPTPAADAGAELPQPRIVRARRWNISLVWLVPAVAIAIAASMLVRSVFLIGPRIEIEFKSADGVEAGKTEVRYKEVVIVQLDRTAARFAVEDTSFWVVKPLIGAAGVSGLGTLLSGAYIGTDAGL